MRLDGVQGESANVRVRLLVPWPSRWAGEGQGGSDRGELVRRVCRVPLHRHGEGVQRGRGVRQTARDLAQLHARRALGAAHHRVLERRPAHLRPEFEDLDELHGLRSGNKPRGSDFVEFGGQRGRLLQQPADAFVLVFGYPQPLTPRRSTYDSPYTCRARLAGRAPRDGRLQQHLDRGPAELDAEPAVQWLYPEALRGSEGYAV